MSPTSPNCQHNAALLITALERFQKLHGRYPAGLNVLVSEKILSTIPRLPWTTGVTREGYNYEVDSSGDFYSLSYSEQDWFGGVGPAPVKTYIYYSVYNSWSAEWVPLEVQALELAGQRFLSNRSSKHLKLFVSILENRFERVRWENVSKVLVTGQPGVVEGRASVFVKADDAEATQYQFVPNERKLAGEIVQEVSAIYRLKSSGSESTWEPVFLAK
jgi:hypothetical protein